jgi:glycosyltransferase involved in cell wall biosynthesis
MRRDWLDRPDGINIFIYSLADELATQGHEVICVAGLTADEEKVRRFFALENYPRLVSVTGLEKTAKYSEHATLWLHKGRHVVDALKPDCILINGVVPCRFSAHSIAISHDTQHRGHYGSLARRLYKAACYRMVNKIVATTEQVRSFLAREVWVPQAKISVIPTCFDLASYKRFPIESRERAILHMGTVSYKNPLGSVEILQKMKTPGALLYITGTTSGELTEKVSSLDPEAPFRHSEGRVGSIDLCCSRRVSFCDRRTGIRHTSGSLTIN